LPRCDEFDEPFFDLSPMIIKRDTSSGFCFGVKNAIQLAEQELSDKGSCLVLGSLVHNPAEEQRLKKLGLEVLNQAQFSAISDSKVLLRAHGEPPSTYDLAQRQQISLIEGTCPIVLKLQKKVAQHWASIKAVQGQIAIYGKPDHAETIGLNGHTDNNALILNDLKDISSIDFERPLTLFAQTTMNEELYAELISAIAAAYQSKGKPEGYFTHFNTLCKQVSGRTQKLAKFAQDVDVLIFISGKSSSNGKVLFSHALQTNPRSFHIENAAEMKTEWFTDCQSVGISGATSTPLWQMDEVENRLRVLLGLL
jgi:4-hydroxy-3-methylbut-2-enyl diphosphate reductase